MSNFRIQAASDEELRAQANFQILRTFPERRSEYFVSGTYNDRISISNGRLGITADQQQLLDSDAFSRIQFEHDRGSGRRRRESNRVIALGLVLGFVDADISWFAVGWQAACRRDCGNRWCREHRRQQIAEFRPVGFDLARELGC